MNIKLINQTHNKPMHAMKIVWAKRYASITKIKQTIW